MSGTIFICLSEASKGHLQDPDDILRDLLKEEGGDGVGVEELCDVVLGLMFTLVESRVRARGESILQEVGGDLHWDRPADICWTLPAWTSLLELNIALEILGYNLEQVGRVWTGLTRRSD